MTQQGFGAVCPHCAGTLRAGVWYNDFQWLFQHFLDQHMSDPAFIPRVTLCDAGAFPPNQIRPLIQGPAQWSTQYLPGIVMQLESVNGEKTNRNHPLLYNADQSPALGPTNSHLRDVPDLPRRLDEGKNGHALLEAYFRHCGIVKKDIIDRWSVTSKGKTLGDTALGNIIWRFRLNCEVPIFSWVHHIGKPTLDELKLFDKITPLQLAHNTSGIPITQNLIIQPRPLNHNGPWRPPLQMIRTNGFPHRLGGRMQARADMLAAAKLISVQQGCSWEDLDQSLIGYARSKGTVKRASKGTKENEQIASGSAEAEKNFGIDDDENRFGGEMVLNGEMATESGMLMGDGIYVPDDMLKDGPVENPDLEELAPTFEQWAEAQSTAKFHQ